MATYITHAFENLAVSDVGHTTHIYHFLTPTNLGKELL